MPDDNNTALNCIGTGDMHSGTNFWSNLKMGNNKMISGVFKTFKGSYTDDEDFELKEDAKAECIGSDGTEVSIYGGKYPFDPTPTNPQIVKFEVAPKSTSDGKLSIDITVE